MSADPVCPAGVCDSGAVSRQGQYEAVFVCLCCQLIQFVQPESVMLELCRGRVNILEMDEDNIEEELKALNMGEKGFTIACWYDLNPYLRCTPFVELCFSPAFDTRLLCTSLVLNHLP